MKRVLGRLRQYVMRSMLTDTERRHRLVGPPHVWKMKRDFQIRFLKSRDLRPEHYLLDIGCGSLRGGIPLIEYLGKGHYVGVERQKDVLDEGRRELRKAELTWKEPLLLTSAEFSAERLAVRFDFVWAFSVLIHLTDALLNETLDIVSNSLTEHGVFYANVNVGDRPEGNWRGFPVVWRSMDFYRETCFRHGLLAADLGALSDLGHVSGDPDQDRQRMLKIGTVPLT